MTWWEFAIFYITIPLILPLYEARFTPRPSPLLQGSNGFTSAIEEFPFQVSLQILNRHICSGVIISNYFIVVAAHCVESPMAFRYEIEAGTSDYTQINDLHKIEKIHIHPNYSRITHDFDVAVIKLKTPLVYSAAISPVPLNEMEVNSDVMKYGRQGYCPGWNLVKGTESKHLYYAEAFIVDSRICEALYEKNVTSSMLCIILSQEDKLVCQGDPSGAFVTMGYLVGIVSWGYGCQNPTYPEIYTNIAYVAPFIKSVANI